MGVRDRIPRIRAKRLTAAEAKAATEAAVRCVEDWNRLLGEGGPVWWSPSIRAALVAGYHWLEVYCPGCRTSRVVDIRAIDRHPEASVGSLVLDLKCGWCPGSAPMPRLLGLSQLAPSISDKARGGTA
jgi:hypothetical protein